MMAQLNTARILAALILPFSASGCSNSDESYDSGYGDGYAVGYNTTCEIRATMIEGDWENSDYSRGYADGQSAGTIACNNDRKDGAVE